MRKKRALPIAILILACTISNYVCVLADTTSPRLPYDAFVIVPVADLVGDPLINAQSLHSYEDLPLCGGSLNPYVACPRLHQLIFNERVQVVEERDKEVLVDLPNAFYITEQDKQTPRTKYWTCKNNLMTLHTLKMLNLDPRNIPSPIDRHSPKSLLTSSPCVVALTTPWHSKELDMIFSVGTRFVCLPQQKKNSYYTVYAFNAKTKCFEEIMISKNSCFRQDPLRKPAQKLHDFITILRSWTETNQGCILYVWGGCSFTERTLNPTINEYQRNFYEKTASFYSTNTHEKNPKAGFDCSGLIVRAAQIVGLPYFYKNTTTIKEYIPMLTRQSKLSEGDLIVIPGHVMVVASLANNTLIEARSYPHGYGKIQEISLKHVFKGITTYAELLEAYHQGKTIYRTNCHGIIQDTITNWSILDLKKLFHV